MKAPGSRNSQSPAAVPLVRRRQRAIARDFGLLGWVGRDRSSAEIGSFRFLQTQLAGTVHQEPATMSGQLWFDLRLL